MFRLAVKLLCTNADPNPSISQRGEFRRASIQRIRSNSPETGVSRGTIFNVNNIESPNKQGMKSNNENPLCLLRLIKMCFVIPHFP